MRVRVIGVLLAAILTAALVTHAQTPPKPARIGVIGEASPGARYLEGFRHGLSELGYTEGRNVVIEYRYAHGLLDRVPKLAAELIDLKVDVLVVGGFVSAQSVKRLTTTVPIVFTLVGDPVGAGLVASFARPGGNATGLSNVGPELAGKQIELLKSAVPPVSRIAVLYNPINPVATAALDGARHVGRALGVGLEFVEVPEPAALSAAFSAVTASRAGAVLAISDPVFGNQLAGYASLALRHRLPAMYGRREFVDAGGLLTYGPNFAENYRRAAGYVDRILRGAKPADLPVERSAIFELAVNLETAKALGLAVPPSVLGRADHVIQGGPR